MSKLWLITLTVGYILNFLMALYAIYQTGSFTLGNLITFLVFLLLCLGHLIKKVIFDGEADTKK